MTTPIIEQIQIAGRRTTDEERIAVLKSPEYMQYLRTLGGYVHSGMAKQRVHVLTQVDANRAYWSPYQERVREVNKFRRMLRMGYDFTPKKIRTLAELKSAAAGTRQISGDSLMLADFWTRAAELAERRGYCSVYDGMAAALGGPRRR